MSEGWNSSNGRTDKQTGFDEEFSSREDVMQKKWIAILTLVTSAGCSTVKTTFVNVDSQGNLAPCPERCVKGVPAIVKVKTHVEVSITQKDYYRKMPSSGGASQYLEHLPHATIRTLDVTDVMTDKMVMIDPKRPVSGQGEFRVAYKDDGSGHLAALNYKAVDTTLKDSASLVSAALKVFGVKPHGFDSNSSKVVEVSRVIAVERFPADQCSHAEIERFVEQYINLCAPQDCQTPTIYAPNHPKIQGED